MLTSAGAWRTPHQAGFQGPAVGAVMYENPKSVSGSCELTQVPMQRARPACEATPQQEGFAEPKGLSFSFELEDGDTASEVEGVFAMFPFS